MSDREAFEAWAKSEGAPKTDWWCRQLDDGGYSCYAVDMAWKAVQAATQHHQSHIEELEQEAKIMRARNERLEAEVAELRKDAALAEVDLFAKDATNGHLSALVDEERTDAERYRWLRGRDLDAIASGGVFAGKTPDNVILNGEDLDSAIDAAIARATHKEQT